METKYPSRHEIDALMKAVLEELDKKRIVAQYDEETTPPIDYRSVVREKGYTGAKSPSWKAKTVEGNPESDSTSIAGDNSIRPANASPIQTVQILSNFKKFLDQVSQHPENNLSKHIVMFGSSEGFYNVKDYAYRAGWIKEKKVRLAKTGRTSTILALTAAGEAMLASL
jgi:hypothetical protein